MPIRILDFFLAHLAIMVLCMIAGCTNLFFGKYMIPIYCYSYGSKRELNKRVININSFSLVHVETE